MLSIPELIKKKRDGETFSDEEVRAFVQAVTEKTIQDCQTGAMLMAIWQKGMVDKEIQTLTREMMTSGEVMSWPKEWKNLMVDKHSTGGVGDKVSLVLAPALAACGCKVPMISGRGLVHTGGTLDKLESIPGFNIHQSGEQIRKILASVGCCIVGQTEMLVPADRVLYAVRDATSTVDNLPLIAGSIISKKGAESLTALVLDVKFGRAALYKDLDSARELAQLLVRTGNGLGIKTGAVLSTMDTVIGRCVGNSLEVIESLETLKQKGPDDLLELVTTLGGMLLLMTGLVSDLPEGRKQICDAVTGGAALSKFQAMMEAQGVASETARMLSSAQSDYYSVLRKSKHQMDLKAPADGVVLDVDGLVLAQVLHKLGAGRLKVGEPINHSVGAELLVSLGQRVKKGDPWLRLHYEDLAPSKDQMNQLENAVTMGTDGGTQRTLVQEIL
ncbi:thymidine phosphorylase [Parambassis ranga]|uniref:Thymidine phosphorylase n=1 Tax=Parambassis ranga TaxID=210632 RepID=A0A6P7HJG7_9TELE|nr:thymidine phosphorylase-like [Parambassis ranga]XP_028255725.1 thymidine phosphorylase-like [Parambassis ranga]XP_028255726.1 thymidine phosphorylase-like [Parambassis ranga]